MFKVHTIDFIRLHRCLRNTSTLKNCVLTGFSVYSSRIDLELALGDYRAERIDPLVSRQTLLPVGKYSLQFDSSVSIQKLESNLKERFGDRYKFYNHISDDCCTASFHDITNSTVLIKTSITLDKDVIPYYLGNFGLKKIQRVYSREKVKFFVVDFVSPQEAERICTEIVHYEVGDGNISLHWYQF